MKRIGLLGGTFNPVHFGHLRSAVEVQMRFALDSICFIPSAIPPHKDSKSVADAADRLEMIRRAVRGYPAFTVSDVELKRSGPSYTIDTVRHFITGGAAKTDFFLIAGLDAFLEIDTWKSFLGIFSLVPFIVMKRPGPPDSEPMPDIRDLGSFLYEKVSKGYSLSERKSRYEHESLKPVYICEVTQLDISSTRIRGMVRKNEPVSFLVPANVELFIKNRGLYR